MLIHIQRPVGNIHMGQIALHIGNTHDAVHKCQIRITTNRTCGTGHVIDPCAIGALDFDFFPVESGIDVRHHNLAVNGLDIAVVDRGFQRQLCQVLKALDHTFFIHVQTDEVITDVDLIHHLPGLYPQRHCLALIGKPGMVIAVCLRLAGSAAILRGTCVHASVQVPV